MVQKYYFDTSIWLDFFEDRDEPNFPKGAWAQALVTKIINRDDKIVYSDNNVYELSVIGYSAYELDQILEPLRPILIFVEATEKQVRKAKDLSLKRDIPKRDALHALIARDSKAILITLDKHFQKTSDIIKPKKPQDFISL